MHQSIRLVDYLGVPHRQNQSLPIHYWIVSATDFCHSFLMSDPLGDTES